MSKLILSLDGGGIRGAATTQFLAKIEQKLNAEHGKSIRDCVDFYAGTSTGSIIALCLATTNMTLEQINQLYNVENANEIFSKNKGWFEIDGVNAPKYEAAGKTHVLQQNLADAKINDVPNGKHVLAVSYSIEKRKPEVIKSTKTEHHDLFSFQVADASSAAPTYFPTKELKSNNNQDNMWLVDGGITANNPTMCAIAEAKKAWQTIPLNEMRVLSIGTGTQTRKINGPESQHWGAMQWITKGHILELLSDEKVVSYQARTIMNPGHYIRVNAELKPQPGLQLAADDALDDISEVNINKLRLLGDFWFEQYGEAVVALLMNQYQGPTLERIDPETGKPIVKGA